MAGSEVLGILDENVSTITVTSNHSIGSISQAMATLARERNKVVAIHFYSKAQPQGSIWTVQPGDGVRRLAERWHAHLDAEGKST